MVGIDLTETRRLAHRLKRTPALAEALFHAGEYAYCDRQRDPAQHLAARFAAKEAVIKALGIDGFDPLDVEVIHGGERCGVVLHGAAAARADELDVTVSISMTHLPEVAAAIALARPRQAGST